MATVDLKSITKVYDGNVQAVKNVNFTVQDKQFVVLVGDHNGAIAIPTWFETVSGLGGEGDHYYSELEGDDVLPDVFIGRLSCLNSTELTTIVNKIVNHIKHNIIYDINLSLENETNTTKQV